MLSNELLLIGSSLLTAAFVYFAWKVNKDRLYSLILIFLILISIGGGKIVEFFGFATNTGNVYYAGVFLATYFLIERYGRKEGIRSIGVGVVGIIFFTVLLQMIVALQSAPLTEQLSTILTTAFSSAPRLAVASLLAYIVSQTANVFLYVYLKTRFDGSPMRHLWLRVNICNVFAQFLDSAVFFMIGFWGVVSVQDIGEILVTGFIIKVLFVMVFSPLLYLNRMGLEEERGYASLTVR